MGAIRTFLGKCRRAVPTHGQRREFVYRKILRRPMRFRDEHGIAYEFTRDDAFASFIDQGSVIDDTSLSRFVERTTVAGDTVMDVGANIGGVSLLAARLVGEAGRVFAFEAEAGNFHRLARNIALNSLSSRVTAIQGAVWCTEGTLQLNVFGREACGWNTAGWFESNGYAPTASKTVRALTLDAFCLERAIERVDLLKIDVEGAEPEVLRGARRLLETHAIKRVVFEISKLPLQGMKHDVDDTLAPLHEAGYVVAAITADGRLSAVSTDEVRATWFANFVALPPDSAERP